MIQKDIWTLSLLATEGKLMEAMLHRFRVTKVIEVRDTCKLCHVEVLGPVIGANGRDPKGVPLPISPLMFAGKIYDTEGRFNPQ